MRDDRSTQRIYSHSAEANELTHFLMLCRSRAIGVPNTKCRHKRPNERRAGFEPAALRLCRPFPWSTRAPTLGPKMLAPVCRRATMGRWQLRSLSSDAPQLLWEVAAGVSAPRCVSE